MTMNQKKNVSSSRQPLFVFLWRWREDVHCVPLHQMHKKPRKRTHDMTCIVFITDELWVDVRVLLFVLSLLWLLRCCIFNMIWAALLVTCSPSCYASSHAHACCCCGPRCHRGSDLSSLLVAAKLSVLAEVSARRGMRRRGGYVWGQGSVPRGVVGGDVQGRDSKARSGGLFSSGNTQTAVWRTQGGKLLFLARQKEGKGEGRGKGRGEERRDRTGRREWDRGRGERRGTRERVERS